MIIVLDARTVNLARRDIQGNSIRVPDCANYNVQKENRPTHGETVIYSGSAGDLPPGSVGFESRTSTSLALCKSSPSAIPESAVRTALADGS